MYTQSGLSTGKIPTNENSEGDRKVTGKLDQYFKHLAKQRLKAGESEKAVTFERYAEEGKERPYEGGDNKLQGRGEQRRVHVFVATLYKKISVIPMVLGTKDIPLKNVI